MQYEGDLYGNIGGRRYFKLDQTTADWDALQAQVAALTADNAALVEKCWILEKEAARHIPNYRWDEIGYGDSIDPSVPSNPHPGAAMYNRVRLMEEAIRRQVANIERWRATGEPAGAEESQSIYEQMVEALEGRE